MVSLHNFLLVLTVSPCAFGAIVPKADAQQLDQCQGRGNGPSSRNCWSSGFDISTDFDQRFPSTGKIVSYTLEITNTTCNPDGSGARLCQLVNGQFPGPTIRANWGDTLSITVKNSLQHNGTSIHFHGVRQYKSPGSDGTNGVSQCAIAPGDSATYKFRATQYGTGWYHSHTSLQYGDGVSGPIVIDGPASANYDIDLGAYMFSDIFGSLTAWQAGARSRMASQSRQAPPAGTNLLINGSATNAAGGGSYNRVNIQRGKKYRLRLINSSVNTYFQVSLDNHLMQVIAADFVPIQPFTTKYLLLAIGQRYDVIIDATQTGGAFWFRANVPSSCASGTIRNGSAIWQYANSSKSIIPTSQPWPGEPNQCVEPTTRPYLEASVPPASFEGMNANLTYTVVNPKGDMRFAWILNEAIWTNYSNPTLAYFMRGDTNYPAVFNTQSNNPQGSWNYWLIYNSPADLPISHPMHLHGHDYYIIGNGTGTFNPSTAGLNWKNPARRDTTTLPGLGWVAIAWLSNNPGAWLLHCHIAFHVAEGMGIQFLESVDQTTLPDQKEFRRTCQNWRAYDKTAVYGYDDSGL